MVQVFDHIKQAGAKPLLAFKADTILDALPKKLLLKRHDLLLSDGLARSEG